MDPTKTGTSYEEKRRAAREAAEAQTTAGAEETKKDEGAEKPADPPSEDVDVSKDSATWKKIYAPGQGPKKPRARPPPRNTGEEGEGGSILKDGAGSSATSQDVEEGGEEREETAEDDDEELMDGQKEAPVLYRWQQDHTTNVNDDFVLRLNADALLPVFLCRNLSIPQHTATDSTNSGAGSAPPPKVMSHYQHATVLDLSPFLTGDVSINRTFGINPTAAAWAAHVNPFGSLGDTVAGNLALSIGPGGEEEGNTTRRTSRVESGTGRVSWLKKALHETPCSFPPPAGLSYLRITVVVDKGGKALLSSEDLHRFNPLSITVASARDLPGVRVEAASQQHHVASSPFALQNRFCSSTYVVVQPLVPELGPRLVVTEGVAPGRGAQWMHRTAFLTGCVDRHLFEETMEHEPLRVELHDRDPAGGLLPSSLERYDRLVTGDEPIDAARPTQGAGEAKPGDEEDDDPAGRAAANVERAKAAVEAAEKGVAKAKGKAKAKAADVLTKAVAAAEAAEAAALAAAAAARGIDVFEVDKIFLEELVNAWRDAGDHYSHGTAKFGLSGLLNQAKPLAAAFAKTNRKRGKGGNASAVQVSGVELKMRESLLPTKRRVMPRGGEDDWALSEGERLVRKPGHYLATDASLRLVARLHRPYRTLEEDAGQFIGATTLERRPFCRAVFIFGYKDVPMLHAVNTAIDAINTEALGDSIQGSLRSHQLLPQQLAGAEAGLLDVVCGFQILDEHCRMIVVEGLAGALQRLSDAVPRASANDKACRILNNLDVCFHRRLYTAFNVDLKKIRLRDPLPILCEMPEIYNRTKVSPACFEALHRLQAIRNAHRLKELAIQSLFPEVDQLLQVESKYGESISMEDIDGRTSTAKKTRATARGKQQSVKPDANHTAAARAAGGEGQVAPPPPPAAETSPAVGFSSTGKSNAGDEAGTAQGTAAAPPAVAKRKGPTDHTNEAFEQSRRDRTTADFLGRQREELERSLQLHEEKKLVRAAERADDSVPCKFVYSGQKLQYTELKKGEIRARLGREKGTHFTYSKDYLAAAVSMVDETRLALDAAAESKAKWKTKRGFVYPAPRRVEDFAKHPMKPSNSRIDSLREPWVENEMHPLPVARSIELAEGQSDFDTIPLQGSLLFGGLHLPKYERPYDNNNLGSERRLPRGGMTLEKNPDFYRSVHLTGAGLVEERAAQVAAEEAAWQAKVVVDSVDFHVGGFRVRDRPLQVHRTDDILKGPPKSMGLKMVRNARLPSGKRVPLRAAPISALCEGEEYADPKDFTVDLRPDDYSTFIAKDETGAPRNFHTHIHREIRYPKSQTTRSHRPIPHMTTMEKTGERWARNASA